MTKPKKAGLSKLFNTYIQTGWYLDTQRAIDNNICPKICRKKRLLHYRCYWELMDRLIEKDVIEGLKTKYINVKNSSEGEFKIS